MKKKLFKIIMAIIFFIVIFPIVDFIFNNITAISQNIREFYEMYSIYVNIIKAILTGMLSFISANGVDLLKLYLERQRPQIDFKAISVTEIRRQKRNNYIPEVVFGNGKFFVYITVDIANRGSGIIRKCYINNEKLYIDDIYHLQNLLLLDILL